MSKSLSLEIFSPFSVEKEKEEKKKKQVGSFLGYVFSLVICL